MSSSTDHVNRPAAHAASEYSTLLHSVQAAGLMRRSYRFYGIKGGVLLLAFAGVWVGFALLGAHWAQLALAACFAVVLTQLMFLGHDAAHRQIFRSGKANEWTALLIGAGLTGISLGWWNTKHNRHHRAPNQIGKDPDISPSLVHFYPLAAPPANPVARFLYGKQGWWFFPLLLVEALHLHAQGIYTVLTAKGMKWRWLEAPLLAVRLGGYLAVLFVFLPADIAVTFLAVQLAVTGLYLGLSFAATHIGMPIVPPDAKIDFLRRQVLMSRNIAGGRTASLAMGGLNYQIEHHLFPSMSRPNLRPARLIVRAYCAEHSISYQEIRIYQALAVVAGYLNRVGLRGASAVSCPTAAGLR